MVAGGAVFAFLVWLPQSIGPVSVADINLEGNALVMEAPQVSGFHGAEQSYELSAARAVQSLANPEEVRLEAIEAKVDFSGEETASVSAVSGIYDSSAETLLLGEGIEISTSNGYRARLETARIDFAAGSMRSDDPVELTTPEATIAGRAIEISQGGRHLLLSGGVRLVLFPGGTGTATPTATADPAAAGGR
jgi:lipopolysaccharide export system protein LptC